MSSSAVRLVDVCVTYPNGTRALDAVNLVVETGERVALVGPSGSGKSTLLNLLNGRVVMDGATVTGTVEVFGVERGSLRGRARRIHDRRTATVRQDLDLIGPVRVIHNVNAGRLGEWSTAKALWSLIRPADREAAGRTLEAVGLESSLLDVRVDELSGGQRQRVALARVLRQQPELLVADEPVASLDPAMSELVLDLVASTSATEAPVDRVARWTAMVSLHQPEFARRFADRVVGVRHGQVAFDVPVDELSDRRLASVYARS